MNTIEINHPPSLPPSAQNTTDNPNNNHEKKKTTYHYRTVNSTTLTVQHPPLLCSKTFILTISSSQYTLHIHTSTKNAHQNTTRHTTYTVGDKQNKTG